MFFKTKQNNFLCIFHFSQYKNMYNSKAVLLEGPSFGPPQLYPLCWALGVHEHPLSCDGFLTSNYKEFEELDVLLLEQVSGDQVQKALGPWGSCILKRFGTTLSQKACIFLHCQKICLIGIPMSTLSPALLLCDK